MSNTDRISTFLQTFLEQCPIYFEGVERTYQANKELFINLANPLLEWAESVIGPNWNIVLAKGYNFLLAELNRAQVEYEIRGHYHSLPLNEVFHSVYENDDYMEKYQWGLYVAVFAWEHHLKLYKFFYDNFVMNLGSRSGSMLDLGSGSGLWSLVLAHHLENWSFEGVDLSPGSVKHAQSLAYAADMSDRVSFRLANALDYQKSGYDAVISCFLLEHLEEPERLLKNMAHNLEPHGKAFLIGALTAAQPDHIYEFRNESEIVSMCEKSGFRVLAMYSSAPASHPENCKFIPRSAGLVLQKKKGDIW